MLRIRVKTSRWAHDDVVYASGEHDLEKPSRALVEAVGAAAAAGTLDVLEADTKTSARLAGAVEDDKVSAGKLEQAQADGRWQEGNRAQYELDQAARAAAAASEGDEG